MDLLLSKGPGRLIDTVLSLLLPMWLWNEQQCHSIMYMMQLPTIQQLDLSIMFLSSIEGFTSPKKVLEP